MSIPSDPSISTGNNYSAPENRPQASLKRRLLILGLKIGLVGFVLLAILVVIMLPTLPSVENIAEKGLKVPLRVLTAEGQVLGEFGDERRIPIAINEVPQELIQALLAAEDDGFYGHFGVDPIGILRAIVYNAISGTRGQGASTITQQVARNFFLSPERTYTRKFKEILLAFKLEYVLTKDEILELYVNKIYLGHRAHGFAAAAQIYYGKALKDLSLPQYAMLAGLPKAPSRNNPISNPENAIIRRNYVLRRMEKLGFITPEAAEAASRTLVTASRHRFEYEVEAPYVAEMVRRYMFKTYAEQSYAGGYVVHTTIRAADQRAANAAVRSGLLAYDRRHGYRGSVAKLKLPPNPDKDFLDEALKEHRQVGGLVPAIVLMTTDKEALVYTQDGYVATLAWQGMKWARRFIGREALGSHPKRVTDIFSTGHVIYVDTQDEEGWSLAQIPEVSGAFVSLRPQDGAILALTGGFDFQQSKFNRVTQAARQPGSNIKPFIYAAAMDKGYNAASKVSGAPIVIEDANLEEKWKPKDASRKFYGPTRLRLALTKSMNLVSVRLLRDIGPKYAVSYMQRFGFSDDKLPPNLSLALGNAALTPLEVVRGFGVFANGGYQVEPYFIARIEDAEGKILERSNPTVVCHDCDETERRYSQTGDKPGSLIPSTATPAPAVYRFIYEEDEAKHGAGRNEAAAPETVNPTQPQTAQQAEDNGDQLLAGQTQRVQFIHSADEIKPRYAPQVLSPENAFIMTTILQDVVRRGTGIRAWLALKRDDLAGKTGTTNDYIDAWFSGYNGNVVATSWIGFDQPATLGRGEFGSTAALPIWIAYMERVLKGTPETKLEQPKGVVAVMIDPETTDYIGPADEKGDTPPQESPTPDAEPSSDTQIIEPTDATASDEEPSPEDNTPSRKPIKEYFVAGSEPKSGAGEGGGAGGNKPKASGSGMEGIF